MGASPSKKLAGRPVVFIIGGGYAGIAVAKDLDAHFNVILCDRKNYFFNNFGSLRALADPAALKQQIIPYDNLLKNGHVVHAQVMDVTPAADSPCGYQVHLHGVDSPVKPDFLVFATGSSYAFPGKIPAANAVDVAPIFQRGYAALESANRVVVVGGGAVGCELAGEVKAFFPAKTVTLVHPKNKLLEPVPNMTEELKDKAKSKLESLGVVVLTNNRVRLEDDDALQRAQSDDTFLAGERVLHLEGGGGDVPTDLTFFATGVRLNRSTFQNHFRCAANGRLVANRSFQLEPLATPGTHAARIFALGDAADLAPQFGYIAGMQGALLAKVIRKLDSGADKLPTWADQPGQACILPLGPRVGVSQLPTKGQKVMGNFFTRQIKGKHATAPTWWSALNAKPPKDDRPVAVEDRDTDPEAVARLQKVLTGAHGLTEEEVEGLAHGLQPAAVQAGQASI